MQDKTKKILYTILLFLGLLSFTFHIFILEKPDGNIGFLLCLLEVISITISITRLFQLSKSFRDGIVNFLGIIFRF